MNFACIQDCSVCPFFCNDVSKNIYENIEKSILPQAFTSTVIPEEQKDAEIEETVSTTENLPVLSDVQFSIEDVEPDKKKFFSWRKK